MALFQATVQAILDSGSVKNIESQISNIGKNNPTKVQIDIDQGYFSGQIDQLKTKLENALSNITVSGRKFDIGQVIDASKLNNVGKQAGNSFNQGFNGEIQKAASGIYTELKNKINFKDIQGMFNLGIGTKGTDAFLEQLHKLETEGVRVTKIVDSINSKGNVKITMQGIDSLGQAVTVVSQLDQKTNQWINSLTRTQGVSVQDISSQLNKAFSAIDTRSFESKIDNIRSKMSQFASSSTEYQNLSNTLNIAEAEYRELLQARQQYEATGEQSYAERAVNAYNSLTGTMKQLNNEYTILNASQDKLISASQKTSAEKNFQQWCQNNSKAVRAYKTEIEQLGEQLKNVQTKGQLDSFNASFNALQSRAMAEGNTGRSLIDSFTGAYQSAIQFASAYVSIYRVFSTIKQGINTVIELDNALIDLKKTTTMSATDLNDFYSEANEIAKQYGSTTKEIIQAAADWSRLGYSSKNESEQMAAFSSQFATISPGMNIESATEALTSIMKAYDVEVEDVKSIMSKINEIGNTQATSNADISEGLKQAASSMSLTGTSFDQTVALFTSAQEVIQNASRVGNGLKTIAMRIRGRHQLPIYCENNSLCYAV